jgi:hypothetical protein
MPRSGRLRLFIKEYKESPRIERLSFIPPFFILAIEIILILHAIALNEIYVILLTFVLLVISIIEIILVTAEIHEHYTIINFDRILTIKLDDFITISKEKNVKKIVEDFITQHPEYNNHRNEIYHTTCQILETHAKEDIEKDIEVKLKILIKRNKKANVDDVIKAFVKKYPKYKKYPSIIYEKTCQLMADIVINNKLK